MGFIGIPVGERYVEVLVWEGFVKVLIPEGRGNNSERGI